MKKTIHSALNPVLGDLVNSFRPGIYLSVLYLFLPNILFLVLGSFIFIDRAFINIDYLLFPLLFAFFHRIIVQFCFALTILADATFAIAPGFHFTHNTIADALKNISNLDAFYTVLYALGLIVVVTVVSYAVVRLTFIKYSRFEVLTGFVPLCFIVLVSLLDYNLSPNFNKDIYLLDHNIANSTGKNVFRMLRHGAEVDAEDGQSIKETHSTATDIISKKISLAEKLPDNIILVVVESLGSFEEEAHNSFLESAFRLKNERKDYYIEVGKVPFAGSTASGEMRELCQLIYKTVKPNIGNFDASSCIPNKLKNIGYKTIAIHGFTGLMYSRTQWYPALGFDDLIFASEFYAENKNLKKCGTTFRGVCDDDAVKKISQTLDVQKSSKNFIYFLSLTAHLPVGETRKTDFSQSCKKHFEMQSNATICKHLNHHYILLDQLNSIIDSQAGKNTAFIIVGDHLPPFLTLDIREMFSVDHVPYYIIWPKT